MSIPRLLLLASLISLCALPLAAQTSLYETPSSSSQLDGLVAPPEFSTHAAPVPPNVRAQLREIQPLFPYDITTAGNDRYCLAIRAYRVKRDHPRSDVTRFAGYTECQPAARFQVKTAVDR